MPEGAAFRRVVSSLAWIGLAFLMFPVVFTFAASFGPSQFIEFPPPGLSLRWYENIGRINRVVDATLVSLGVAALSGTMATVLGAAAAFALVRAPIPGKAAVTSLLLSPIALPIEVRTFRVSGPPRDASRMRLERTCRFPAASLALATPASLRGSVGISRAREPWHPARARAGPQGVRDTE